MQMVTKPIRIREETRNKLNDHKIHPRETYDDVIIRLIKNHVK